MIDTLKLQNKKVVVVEDDKFLGGLVVSKLIAAGAKVTLVNEGGSAFTKIKEVSPDAIVLDLLLPDVSGFDVLKQIRENKDTKNTPVIVLSNLSDESDVQKAKDLGTTDFLIKASVNMNTIVARVAQSLP